MSTPVLNHELALADGQTARSGRLLARRAEALFTSDLSAQRDYTQIEVAAAIRRAIGAHHGIRGCAGEVAAAYGEHPETAARRMRWARAVITGIDAPAVRPNGRVTATAA
jgi:threonine aldolase